jgi:hypothetical protein
MNPKEDFQIDQYNLDKEWMKQATLYQEYAQRAADAEREKDRAKANLDLVMAELDTKIRSIPANYGLKDKPNNDQVVAIVIQQDAYKDALTAHLNAKYNLASMEVGVETMGHKKSALDNMVRMVLAGYAASKVSVPREVKDDAVGRAVLKNTEELNDKPIVGTGVRRRVSG